jgi:O-antigen ligase
MLSCLPLTPAPLKKRKRVAMCLCLVVCAILLFNTDRIQQRMFVSGSGELSDLYWGNPDLKTSGRSFMWDILWEGVRTSPWFGNGWNSHRVALLSAGLPTYAPHNDWLKYTYDMGFVGAGLYFCIMLWHMAALVKIARSSDGAHRMLAYGAATAFVPYMLIMLTDNVVLYVQFFGNLHFVLIGVVYGALKHDKDVNFPDNKHKFEPIKKYKRSGIWKPPIGKNNRVVQRPAIIKSG